MKKQFLIFLCLLSAAALVAAQVINPYVFSAAGGGGPVAFVQGKAAASGDTLTAAVTLDSNPTAGNCLVAVLSYGGAAPSGGEVTDDDGNTWTLHDSITESGKCAAIYVAKNISVSGTMTITGDPPGGATYPSIVVGEYSGVDTTTAVTATNNNTATSTTPSTGTVVCPSGGAIVGGAGGLGGDASTNLSADDNLVAVQQPAPGVNYGTAQSYILDGGTDELTYTIASSQKWYAVVVALQP